MDDKPLAPPDGMNFVGTGDFGEIGRHFFDIFIRDGGLQPHHRVLDVGSGIGRMAIPLTGYLKPPGGYDGFDVVDVGVKWCQENITPRFRHFRFRLADVYNRAYHPAGRFDDRDYRFPYPSGTFDFVFLTSVFTHMLPAGLENYLGEIARVLKVGGRCVITYFLRTEETLKYSAVAGAMQFAHPLDGCWTVNPAVPEDALCYEESDILRLYQSLGLTLDGQPRYGAWSGRPKPYSGQDVVFATKVCTARPPAVVRAKRLVRRMRDRLRARGWRHGLVGAAGNLVGRAREHVQAADRAA